MPLQATSGAASYDAFGGGVPVVTNYIEDVFSTYLYTGNGTTGQTINNGIDLTEGGLVVFKNRADASWDWIDTERGGNNSLRSNSTGAQYVGSSTEGVTAFNSNGFTLGANIYSCNGTSQSIASWTFRKQKKFFDVVTYSGSSSTQNIAHNLGSVPGCIIVKRTSGAEDWFVYHTSLGNTKYLKLNTTGAEASGFAAWNNTSPTSTQFTVLGGRTEVNAAGSDYVAYLFAHDAGGFGLSGTDNVISCGSYVGTGSSPGPFVDLGWEPQFILTKVSSAATWDWVISDTARGLGAPSSAENARLYPNLSSAEGSFTNGVSISATGFNPNAASNTNVNGATHIYIAIRRGPMKVPTSGTSVYETVTSSASAGTALTTGFPVDLQMQAFRSTTGAHRFMDRLRGVSTNSTAGSISLASTSTSAETTSGSYSLAWNNTGFQMTTAFESTSGVFWNFRRAPSFFDEVCYTGTGSAVQTYSHNLGVAPELMIVKCRNDAGRNWTVYSSALGNGFRITLQQSLQAFSTTVWNSTSPTATQFTVTSDPMVGANTFTYVNYLFATCAGVSKVGNYTGTATTKQIDCGFTGGARFVLIKRTDDTGDWYVWDSARGIVSGNDPYLLLNSTAAEDTSTDYIDTYSAGFEISSTAPSAINASGGTFVFLAIA